MQTINRNKKLSMRKYEQHVYVGHILTDNAWTPMRVEILISGPLGVWPSHRHLDLSRDRPDDVLIYLGMPMWWAPTCPFSYLHVCMISVRTEFFATTRGKIQTHWKIHEWTFWNILWGLGTWSLCPWPCYFCCEWCWWLFYDCVYVDDLVICVVLRDISKTFWIICKMTFFN